MVTFGYATLLMLPDVSAPICALTAAASAFVSISAF